MRTITLTYDGDQTAMIGEVKGPTARRELITARSASYDPDTGRTQVVFWPGTRCCRCFVILEPDEEAEAVTPDVQGLRLCHPNGRCPR